MNGYSTALSFKNFEAHHVVEVETFIKSELMDLLTEKCRVHNLTFEENDKVFFFGIYASDYKKFRFVGGDKSIIKEIVDYIKKKVNENGTEYFTNIAARTKNKIFLEDTCKLSVGIYFSKKKRTLDIPVGAVGERSTNEAEMKSSLFLKKLKPLFELLPSEMTPVHPINESIIDIIKNGVKVFADVICPFCSEKKPHRIQCDLPINSNVSYWNTSNFKKHIKKHEKDKNGNVNEQNHGPNTSFIKKEENIEKIVPLKAIENETNSIANKHKRRLASNQSTRDEPKISKIPARDNENNLQSHIFEQISKQNLFIMSSTLKVNEQKEVMSFELNSKKFTVMISEIDPYGSCLFGALAHQIYGCEIKSEEHERRTAELRVKVINHIQRNFERFKFHLKGRVYEESRDPIIPATVDSECKFFLNACLPKAKCYGGIESIIAISEVMELNIVIISEDGDCHTTIDFNNSFKRTVLLAHRLSGLAKQDQRAHNIDRNHYDSVSEIKSDILYKIAEHLNEKNVIKAASRFNNSVVSLNSTLGE